LKRKFKNIKLNKKMKNQKYQIQQHNFRHTLRYRMFAKGIENLDIIEAESKTKAIQLYLDELMNRGYTDLFFYNDTKYTTGNGRIVFETGDNSAEFGDYQIIAEEISS
jgi:hypothetical protein